MKIKGFTIIELLVVIVIIGILATIAIPHFAGYSDRAKDAKKQVFTQESNVILFATTTKGTEYPFDKIDDGINDTTLADIHLILHEQGITIPDIDNDYQYWYFSKGLDYVVSSCSMNQPGQTISMGTMGSSDQIECTTNNKIPTAIVGGRFDGTVNFELTP